MNVHLDFHFPPHDFCKCNFHENFPWDIFHFLSLFTLKIVFLKTHLLSKFSASQRKVVEAYTGKVLHHDGYMQAPFPGLIPFATLHSHPPADNFNFLIYLIFIIISFDSAHFSSLSLHIVWGGFRHTKLKIPF